VEETFKAPEIALRQGSCAARQEYAYAKDNLYWAHLRNSRQWSAWLMLFLTSNQTYVAIALLD
ncbi:MAG: hypothetical protein AAGB04_17330, partial [Pseudomonadota bacterium]